MFQNLMFEEIPFWDVWFFPPLSEVWVLVLSASQHPPPPPSTHHLLITSHHITSHHTSHITHHTLHITHHTSHHLLTHHTSHIAHRENIQTLLFIFSTSRITRREHMEPYQLIVLLRKSIHEFLFRKIIHFQIGNMHFARENNTFWSPY